MSETKIKSNHATDTGFAVLQARNESGRCLFLVPFRKKRFLCSVEARSVLGSVGQDELSIDNRTKFYNPTPLKTSYTKFQSPRLHMHRIIQANCRRLGTPAKWAASSLRIRIINHPRALSRSGHSPLPTRTTLAKITFDSTKKVDTVDEASLQNTTQPVHPCRNKWKRSGFKTLGELCHACC